MTMSGSEARQTSWSVLTHQVDVKVVGAFGVGQAEVQAELVMLKRKGHRLKVREEANQRFLLVRLSSMTESHTRKAWMLGVGLSVMDQKGLPQHRRAAARFEHITEQRGVDPMRQKCEVISMSWPR